MKNRRTKEGYRLRIYIDAIKEVKEMTDEQWMANQCSRTSTGHFLPKNVWLHYLESCAVQEADRYLKSEAA